MRAVMSTDPFVAQLGSLCRAETTTAKWVVVPSHAIGRTLEERLAREGVDWVNLRFVTPFDLALQTAAPRLLAQGLDPLPEGLGPSLVMRLLLERPASAACYFRPLAEQPQMGEALWAALRDLRLAGISPGTLPRAAFDEARKHAELSELLAAYEQHLSACHRADAATVYREAAAHAGDGPIGAGDLLLEAADLAVAPPLVRLFLDALPAKRRPCAVPRVPGLTAPRRFRPDGCREQAVSSRLAFLLAPGEAPAPEPGQHLEMFHAVGREAEVEAVLRRILAASPTIPLDQVEVACAAPDAAPLLFEKAQRFELPITMEDGVSAATTRPARALRSLCGWVDSNFTATRLRRLLLSGDLRVEFPDGSGGGRAARLLSQAGATWGRDTYQQSLAALAARHRTLAEDGEELDEEERKVLRDKAGQVEFLSEWIANLLALVPLPDERGNVALSSVVSGVSTVIERHGAVSGRLDGAAVATLRDALADLLALEAFRCPMRQALAAVLHAVDGVRVWASRARPGHLHVSPLRAAGYAGRPFTFVVGVEEGAVFPSRLEDPVLLDAERTRISLALPTSHDRLEEAVHAVVSRLAVLPVPPNPAHGSVCLSYSCRNLRDGRETAPSWVMLQALRVEQGRADLTYEQLREALGTPETLVARHPDQALSDAAWWLASLDRTGTRGAAAVAKAFPALAAGRAAAAARDSEAFTEWDGFVPAARAVLDPRVSGKAVSVTRLERLVSCPFRYFMEHGLGVEVMDEEPDRDEWLDPLQRGSTLHEVFATLCREARGEGRRVEVTKDLARARELADARLSDLRALCPPPSEVVFDRERAELLRDVELFVDFESNRHGGEPVALEVAFGHADGGEEPLAQADPIVIPLGRGEQFLLRGTIDRIDRLDDGSFEVIDYKTGRFDRRRWEGTFRGGAMLQHALYAVAAASLLRRRHPAARVSRGVYEFPSARGGGERVEIAPPSGAALVQVLADLFDVMACGAFLPALEEAECTYCDFSRACQEPVEQARRKLGNARNTMLDAYRRLTSHE